MIESLQNKQIKNIIELQTKVKERKKQELFIVEGTKMIAEIPPIFFDKLFLSEEYYKQSAVGEIKRLPVEFEIVKNSIFKKMSGTKTPQGILAIVKQRQYQIEELLTNKHPLLMVLEDLQDPGNLGTIIRTSEGAGVDGIILTKNSVDIYNPKVVRATMGSIFRMPFYISKELDKELIKLKEHNVKLYAAHLQGEKYYYKEKYNNSGVAFLIGNESNGLSNKTIKKADSLIKIPLYGQVESLNASIAASILMYEASNQRRK
ncbi:MAG: TrmH family RNA methyltransferase [Eubacteriales bacterium]